ncbi:histidine phosphatase family protein [Nocardioides sp. zg-1308]|uniref:Histidine phosphatase family protein n=1 Tax=Nocardioides renjunii TaxID=3095075 RepID=A0ABU5KCD0_9ACTN|nr:histidine phosphatase family protein [Nocardioides sp. S-58]MDZ5662509.1 histidine phosphatase family protein [Nocardioides sp. S-58]NPD05819.1 histidine phosphatase family protein [Nocardioides sp. zg-1308]
MADLQCAARVHVARHGAGTTGDPDPFADTFASWLDGDLTARIPGAESGHEVAARYEAVLLEIADEHRGEAVLVVSHGGVMRLALPALARNLTPGHARGLPLDSCDVVALDADADGWLVRSWADRPLA